MMYETFSQSERPDPSASAGRDTPPEADLLAVNARFNAELSRQIAGTLPPGHVYQLGRPGGILLSAGIPDLPIEMASARLLHKSNQENHPFPIAEVHDLVIAIQTPLAVFRSATRLDSKVIMTELTHAGRNFVVAIRMNKAKSRIFINDIRSIHPRTTTNILSWIMDDLTAYVDAARMSAWIAGKIKTRDYLNSSNPAEVRQSLVRCAKIVKGEDNGKPNRRFEI